MEMSCKSKEEEEDLVSFNDIMDACDHVANALEHWTLNWNKEPMIWKRKQ